MLKYMHPEMDINVAYIVAIVVFGLVFLFNSYKLGRLNLNWYWNMSERNRGRLKKVILIAVVGAILVLLVPVICGV